MTIEDKILELINSDKIDPSNWKQKSLIESIHQQLIYRNHIPFHNKAWFIMGIYVGVIFITICYGLSTRGTLIYDLLMKP